MSHWYGLRGGQYRARNEERRLDELDLAGHLGFFPGKGIRTVDGYVTDEEMAERIKAAGVELNRRRAEGIPP